MRSVACVLPGLSRHRTRLITSMVVLAGLAMPAMARAQVAFNGTAQSVNFGTQAIGTTSNAETLNFSIASGTAVGSIAVMTAGSPNLDFANAGGPGSCTPTTYSSATTCVINVTFKPGFAGMRPGAVVFFSGLNNTGTVLASVPIYGVGTGPQIAFGTNQALAIAPVVNGQATYGLGVAVDGAGDLFIADQGNYRVVEVPAGGGAAIAIQASVNGENSFPYDVAIDGAGNLFIADLPNSRVVEIPVGGGAAIAIDPTVNGVSLNRPYGVSTDAMGDLFIADYYNNRIVEVPAGGGAAIAIDPIVNGDLLSGPVKAIVDAAGNLFISNSTNVVEVPAGGGPATAIAPTVNGQPMYFAEGLAVDGAGDLFIADGFNNRVLEVPAGGGAPIAIDPTASGASLNGNSGLAIDGAGDLFISDVNNARVVVAQRSTAPSLQFANTAVGSTSSDSPQMVQVQNGGNMPLILTALSYPADFPEAGGDPNPCTGSTSLDTGQACDLPIKFIPPGDGTFSEDLSLTDNSRNVVPATQMISVNGVGAPLVSVLVGSIPGYLLGFSVDGVSYYTPHQGQPIGYAPETWVAGSQHTLATQSPQVVSGTQYTFNSWNENINTNGNISLVETATTLQETVTAASNVPAYYPYFTVSGYQLSIAPNNAAYGSVTPASGTAYNTGAVVNITATPNAGYYFTGWTGSADIASTSSASTTITINGPETIVANFLPLPILVVTTATDDAGTAAHCTQQAAPGTGTDAACSLRDALAFAQASIAPSINISFDSTAFAATNTAAANTISLSYGTLNVPSNTSVNGATSGSGYSLTNLVTVNGNATSTVFTVNSGVSGAIICGLIIVNGNGLGGGIYSQGQLQVLNSTIADNVAAGHANFTGAGGIYIDQGALTVSNSTISGNSTNSTEGGGGIYNQGTLTITNSTITGNTSATYGGGIANQSGNVNITGSTVSSNSGDAGGGISNSAPASSVKLANSIVAGNTATSGYAPYTDFFNGYSDNGGNQLGTSVMLTPLGNYGGATQTMVPLPGSAALCSGTLAIATAASLTTDQRGVPFNTVCPSGFVDTGAVQTQYVLAFTTEPPAITLLGQVLTPAPVLTLTENGAVSTAVTSPVSVTGSPTALSGTASQNLASGLANFNNLVVPTATPSETLTATLAFTSAFNLTAASSSITVDNPSPGRFQITTTTATINNNVAFPITVTALLTGGGTDTYYNGTVSFTSSDPGFVNPGPLTLTSGVGQANVTLETLGSQTITATDTVTNSELGTGNFNVTPAPTADFQIAVPAAATSGTPFQFTVSAYDIYGNAAIGYSGTITFTSTDPSATLPSPATLVNGMGIFQASLATPGTQTITATDAVNTLTITSSGIIATAPSLVVNTVNDDFGTAANCTAQTTTTSNATDSACSLRDALKFASIAGAANIGFDSTAFAASNGTAANTIGLSNGILNIPSNTSITGPTTGSGATLAQVVTVDGNALNTVFNVSGGVTNASIGGLSIVNGNNTLSGYGGGIYNGGTLTVANCSISGNQAPDGGGVENDGTLVLTGSSISGNTADQGAGIWTQGTLTVSNSTIANNTANQNAGAGGLRADGGTVNLVNSTVSGNSSGGIFTLSTTLTLTDSTVYGNSGGQTAGIFSNGGNLILFNSTLAGNQGNGLFLYYAQSSMSNSIVSGNSTDIGNQSSTLTDNGGNVIGGVAFSALANYGGLTETAIPVPGDGAICGGTLANATTASVTADQRGYPFDPLCPSGFVDSGAVQTSYALAFTTQPPTTVGAEPMSPAPAVQLSESGAVATTAGNSFAMTDSAGLLNGTTSANLASGLATFPNLDFTGPTASDALTATLALNSSLNLKATSNSFAVATPSPTGLIVTTTASPIFNTLPFTITVAAQLPGGGTDTHYNGTVFFTSSDAGFVNPGPLTLSAGIGQTTVTLATLGPQTITATDSITSALMGMGNFLVTQVQLPAAGLQLAVPPAELAGTVFYIAVSAVDIHGNPTTNYAGTLTFTTTDSSPSAYVQSPVTITNGAGTAFAILATPGIQTITATDAANSFTVTSNGINVTPPTLVVNTTIDDYPPTYTNCSPQASAGTNTIDFACSLRDALQYSGVAGAANISFDSTAFAASNGAAANTISLTNSTLIMPSNTSIVGPTTGSGASMAQIVTVSAAPPSSVFYINSGVTASISGLIIENGGSINSNGGNIYNGGALTITNSSILGGQASNGGGIENDGTLVLAGSTVTGNTGNSAGGIGNSNNGTLTVTNSTISNNTTGAGGSSGGGISIFSGTATLLNSTVSGNYTGSDGGGISNNGNLTLTNSTVYGNQTGDEIGGIINDAGSLLTLVSSTIADNQGDGVFANNAQLSMSNSVLSGNGADLFNQGPAVTDNGGNLISGVTLAPLANYGGPTQTALPLPGSTAICGGNLANANAASLTTDQRGDPLDPLCPAGFVDSGAVQSNYALAFTVQPPATVGIEPISPAPVVQLTESGVTASAVPNAVAMTDSAGLLNGTTTVNLSSGLAAFSNLDFTAGTASDTLTATLALNASQNLTAISNGFAVTTPAPTHFLVTTTASPIYNGVAFTITVTALLGGGGLDTLYNGAVSFTSSDAGFVNPGPLTLSGGTAQTSVTLATLGSQTITATDITTSALMGTGNFTVSQQQLPAVGLSIGVPSSALAGSLFNFTVTAIDIHGNTAATYPGTVVFTSTDPIPYLPSPTTLTNGTGTFQALMATPGTQTITVTDPVSNFAVTSSGITVTPPNLVVNTAMDDFGNPTYCTPQATTTTNTADSACSLRDALQYALYAGAANIGFDSTAFAATNGTAANTIQLVNGTLYPSSNTSIAGPTTGFGATLAQIVTVDALSQNLAFFFNTGVTNVSISGLSIANGNNASSEGGGIYNDGVLTVANTSLTGGQAYDGGGIDNDGTLVLTGSTVTGNSAIYGGGILNRGTLTVTNSTFAGNSTTSFGYGGGLCGFSGSVTSVTGSTFSGNSSSGDGGAICNFGGTFTIEDSTVYGNSTGGTAGGVFAYYGSMTLANNTIADNSEDGLYLYSGQVTTSNNVVSGNAFDLQNFTATVTDNGGNQIGGVLLAPLAYYGGPTQTAIPQPGSTAVCGGTLANATAASLTTDQRGYAFDPACPSGAVDSGAAQVNYALAFTTQPPANVTTLPILPAPVVGLTESGVAASAASGSVAMTDNDGVLAGIDSAALSAGSATFGNLIVQALEASDTLTATLPLNPALTPPLNLTAVSNGFQTTVAPATLISPNPGSVLSPSSQTFTWTAGAGVTAYWFNLGYKPSGAAAKDVYNSGEIHTTSVTVNSLGAYGQTVYATLYSLIHGAWQPLSYTFIESGAPVPAVLTLPTSGTLLNGSATFTWSSGDGVTYYWINVGDSSSGAASKDLYSSGPTTSTTASVSGLPTYGGTLYVTLYSNIYGAWQPTVYTFTETGTPQPATLTFPGLGATLSATSQTFNWSTGSGVTYYWLNLGYGSSGAAAKNIYSSGPTNSLTATVTGLPSYGVPIYATLYSYINGVWQPTVYTFTSSGAPVAATMISPTSPSTLPSPSATFTWTAGGGVTAYWLNLGTSPTGVNSKNIYDSESTANTSATVTGLPSNGETVYATLYSLINGVWQSVQYTYTAF